VALTILENIFKKETLQDAERSRLLGIGENDHPSLRTSALWSMS